MNKIEITKQLKELAVNAGLEKALIKSTKDKKKIVKINREIMSIICPHQVINISFIQKFPTIKRIEIQPQTQKHTTGNKSKFKFLFASH